MKTWDVIIVGAGVIGLSLAWRLRIHGAEVLVIEKGEPAREATFAAGGMIAHCDPNTRPELADLGTRSAEMFPEFVRELIEDSGENPDLRDAGTLLFPENGATPTCESAKLLSFAELTQCEPLITRRDSAWLLPERSVDPRALGNALFKADKHREVDFVTGSPVVGISVSSGRAVGARTVRSEYRANVVVNCAGAWADELGDFGIPTVPIKGQMVALIPAPGIHGRVSVLEHVVRAPDVYLIPRSDGRLVLGATVEHAGFDKQVIPAAIQELRRAAEEVVPAISEMRTHEAWAGLRPGTPDGLPILGVTSLPGYYAATGHYRDGILLAPITALVMTQLLMGERLDFDLAPFSPERFE